MYSLVVMSGSRASFVSSVMSYAECEALRKQLGEGVTMDASTARTLKEQMVNFAGPATAVQQRRV